MSVTRRKLIPELMDRPDVDPDQLARSLADLRAANRWLGGTPAILRLLEPLLREIPDRPIRIVDVATGSADIPVSLSRWAARRRERVEVTAVDLHRETLEAARRQTAGLDDVRVVAGDALRLPFAGGAFHLALCATALHHFTDAEAATVLGELARVTTAGVVVLDLRRSRTALAAVQLLAWTVWRRHPVTRNDGPASVRGAFTSDELRRLARLAGMEGGTVKKERFFRQSLVYVHSAGGHPGVAAERGAGRGAG